MLPIAGRRVWRRPGPTLRPSQWWLIVAWTALLTPACQKTPSHSQQPPVAEMIFSAPVRLQLPTAGGLPAVDIDLAFNRGATIQGLLEPIGSAVYKALKACPLVVDAIAEGADATVAFSVADDRISPQTPRIDDASQTCLTAALAGDRLSTPPGMDLSVRARVMVHGTTRAETP